MSEDSPKFGRRDFLKIAGLTAAGALLSSCAPKEIIPTPEPKKSEPTITPTVKPTETKLPTPEPSPTPFPTEVPKPTPTEILREKWGKVWVIGEGVGTGGPESGLTNMEERFGNFIEQITGQLEAKGESLKQAELFVGAFPRPEVDTNGKPKLQSGELSEKNSILCAYIFGKTGMKEVYCATEGEKGKEAQVGKISDVFTPEEKIWGASCQEKADGSVVVSCTDGTTYETEETVFGAGLTKLISEKETMTGYLFTAVAFQQKELSPSTFFLSIKDEKKLPFLPSGKEGIDIDKFIPVFDLASARFNVWESSPEKDNPYVGNWDLNKGEWVGEKGWGGEEGYGKLFVEEDVPELKEAIELPGLKRVWNRKYSRVDYLDSDGHAIAYWADARWEQNSKTGEWDLKDLKGSILTSQKNEPEVKTKGYVEIQALEYASVRSLDLKKHGGLFVDWEPEVAGEKAIAARKVPLPNLGNQGLVSEGFGVCPILTIEGVLPGIPFEAPFSGKIDESLKSSDGTPFFFLVNDESHFSLSVCGIFEEALPKTVKAGEKIFQVKEKTLTMWGGGMFPKAQIIMVIADMDQTYAYMTFNDLLRDEAGRFVRLKN